MPMQRVPLPLFRTILFAADLSECSRKAFRVACSLASEEATRLVVVYVVERMQVTEQVVGYGELGVPVFIPGEDRADLQSLMERLRACYAPGHPIAVEYQTRSGDVPEEILQAAEELGCDLIVMGTHGRTGLDRLLMGSVAEAVMRRARCPVLTVKLARPAPPPVSGDPPSKSVIVL